MSNRLVNAFDALPTPPKRVIQSPVYVVTIQQIIEKDDAKPEVKETVVEMSSENMARRLMEIDYRLEYSKKSVGWTNHDGSVYAWVTRK